jgi:hypothetical protein
MTPKQFLIIAETLGFLASIALAYQAVRLLRHQRSVRELKATADELNKVKEQPAGEARTKAIALAEKGARSLEKAIGQWDKRDQYIVFIGLGGLILSFGIKLCGLYLEP